MNEGAPSGSRVQDPPPNIAEDNTMQIYNAFDREMWARKNKGYGEGNKAEEAEAERIARVRNRPHLPT